MLQGPNSGKASTRALAPAARWAGLSCSKGDRKTKIVRFQTTRRASAPTLPAEGVFAATVAGGPWVAPSTGMTDAKQTATAAHKNQGHFTDFNMSTFRAATTAPPCGRMFTKQACIAAAKMDKSERCCNPSLERNFSRWEANLIISNKLGRRR